MEDLKDLLTAQELADAVNLSKQTVLNYEKAGAIKAGVKLANGQCFFGEDAVPTLLGLSVSKRYKDNTLAVFFGGPDECRAFEEAYSQYLESRGILRVDDPACLLRECLDSPKWNPMHKRLCMIQSVEETLKACEKEINRLPGELQERLVLRPDIGDKAAFLGDAGRLLYNAQEVSAGLGEDDRKIYTDELWRCRRRKEKIEQRYSHADMARLIRELKQPDARGLPAYEPERPAVRSIWRRVGRRYLWQYTDEFLGRRIRGGYASVLCMGCQDTGGIYGLLSKAMHPCIRKVELYGSENIAPELGQVVRFLGECREVAVKPGIPGR